MGSKTSFRAMVIIISSDLGHRAKNSTKTLLNNTNHVNPIINGNGCPYPSMVMGVLTLRPGCWLSTIPANGMLLSPEGGGGCSCGKWMEASIGFMPINREASIGSGGTN